jgi:hypothetical protein
MHQQLGVVDPVAAARAEALFASDLSAYSRPTRGEVDAAISWAVRRFGGSRGCAGEVAAAYGDYPEVAVSRMRWARAVVAAAYPCGRSRSSRFILAICTGGDPDHRADSAALDPVSIHAAGHFVDRGARPAPAPPTEAAPDPAMAGSRA